MKVIVIIWAVCAFLVGLSAILLPKSYRKEERKKHAIFKHLYKFRHQLIIITCFALTCAIGLQAMYLLREESSLELTQDPAGEVVQRATITGFKKELEDAAAELVNEAEDYFNAADRDFKAMRYRDAATNYQKSIDVIPTKSAYLNLGLCLSLVSEFQKAEEALISGLQTARKEGKSEFEGAFLGSIGNNYARQGKLDEALKKFKAALEIFKKIDDPLGQGKSLGNIGSVYSQQEKLDEALKKFKAALEIFKKIDNFLGQANSRGNIGTIYFQQEKSDEALIELRAALDIFEEIDDPLGQAKSLGNIGKVYSQQEKLDEALIELRAALDIFEEIDHPLNQAIIHYNISIVYLQQEKWEEALKSSRQAHDIYLKIGVVTKESQAVEEIIELLESTMLDRSERS